MGGYIYVICDPANEVYKIGVTRDLKSNRIKKLQTGNPNELHIVYIYKCDYPFRLETILHNHYSNFNVMNEWFALSPEQVFDFKNICKEKDRWLHSLLSNPFFSKNIK